jgi:hypothetical protein
MFTVMEAVSAAEAQVGQPGTLVLCVASRLAAAVQAATASEHVGDSMLL